MITRFAQRSMMHNMIAQSARNDSSDSKRQLFLEAEFAFQGLGSESQKLFSNIDKRRLNQLIPSKGSEDDIRQIKDYLKTAAASIFEPIGPTVKDSVENSDRCKGQSACEVPNFEFLSEDSRESEKPGPLQYLKGLKAQNENQLLECSG